MLRQHKINQLAQWAKERELELKEANGGKERGTYVQWNKAFPDLSCDRIYFVNICLFISFFLFICRGEIRIFNRNRNHSYYSTLNYFCLHAFPDNTSILIRMTEMTFLLPYL